MRLTAMVLVVLIGIGLMMYPFVTKAMSKIELYETAKKVEESLNSDTPNDVIIPIDGSNISPDDYANQNPQPADAQGENTAIDYNSTDGIALDKETQALGLLYIKDIGLKITIVNGAGPAELKVHAGQLQPTAKFGEIGNTVIAAHRSYTVGHQFNRMGELKRGAQVDILDMKKNHYIYRVTSTVIVETDDPVYFDYLGDGRRTLTLLTCHPLLQSTYRLVKICDLVAILDSKNNVVFQNDSPERDTPSLPNVTLKELNAKAN